MNRRKFLIGSGALALSATGAVYLGLGQTKSMTEYNASAKAIRATISKNPDTLSLVRYATLAANGHNTQPWKFRIREKSVEILPDFLRRAPVVDPDDHHLFVSLGCAAENLYLAADAYGRSGNLQFNPENKGSILFKFEGNRRENFALADAIPKRQSTRSEYSGRPVSSEDLKILSAASAISGVDLVLITDRQKIKQTSDLVISGNSVQMADASFMRELKSWLRFSPREAMETGDGLFSALGGNPALPEWLGPRMFDLFFRTEAENDKYARHILSSSGIAIFIAQKEDHDHWYRVGRACQRFAIQATALGLKHAFINQPVEVKALRSDMALLIGFPGRPDIIMRFGYGSALPYSARRQVEAVLV